MTNTVARYRSGKLIFETMVDLDAAMKLKKGQKIGVSEAIRDNAVYLDLKKGMRAGNPELVNVFGTNNFPLIVEQIIKKGNIEITKEFRDESLDTRKKQVIEFLVKNAVDARTGRPFTPDVLKNAIKESGVNVQDKPVDKQINLIIDELKKIIPLKVETKKIKIIVPASHTGKVYGLFQDYKEKEDWLSNGDLEVIIRIPAGIQMEFYDKLNSVTHGSAITQEMKE